MARSAYDRAPAPSVAIRLPSRRTTTDWAWGCQARSTWRAPIVAFTDSGAAWAPAGASRQTDRAAAQIERLITPTGTPQRSRTCLIDGDLEPAVEGALEELLLARGCPPRNPHVAAVGDEVQPDGAVDGLRAGVAHQLVARALEVLRQPQQRRAAVQPLRVALDHQGRKLAEGRRALAVIARDLGDQRDL